jgi:hypothetical protein
LFKSFIVDFLALEEDILLCIFILLVFLCWNLYYTSKAKLLVGSFNYLNSFSWNSLNVQTGQCSGWIDVLFHFPWLGIWLRNQAFIHCSRHWAWSPALLGLR